MKDLDLAKFLAGIEQARTAFARPDDLQSQTYHRLYKRILNLELEAHKLLQQVQSAKKQ